VNIVYVSCVEIGLTALEIILEAGWPISGLITLDKKRSGKTSGYVDFGPICRQHGIEYLPVEDINAPKTVEQIERWQPDLLLVCGWQRLLNKPVLSIARENIGVHSSLLPKYRGRAPVNWAIICGEKETGVTVFSMEQEADSGPILGQRSFPIKPLDTCRDVYDSSARATGKIICEILPKLANGTQKLYDNPSRQHKCMPKRTPEDGSIDWSRSALELHDFVRALTHPYPGAFTKWQGQNLYIWEALPLHKELDLKLRSAAILNVAPSTLLPFE
jgi:methionyl-tRNA formyltransferase